MAEAAPVSLQEMEAERRPARVIAVMEGQNTASLRVAERAGFTRISCIETRHRGEPGLLLTYERR